MSERLPPQDTPARNPASMRPFWIVWTGQAFSLLGSQVVQFGIVWWLTKATGSATVLTTASLFALLPQILIGPFAGALVDRWPRKAVMIAADALIALATLALAALFWAEAVETWHVYLLLLIRGAGGAFHFPAMQASTTLMVPAEHLARVGGLNQGLAGLMGIFIPPLGAVAVELLPMQGVLAIDVGTAVLAVAALAFVHIPQPEAAAGPRLPVLSEMRLGLRFVWDWKALMILAGVGVTIHMLGRPAAALTPLLIVEHFGGGAAELGWWQMANGIGAVIGGAALGIWGGFRRKVVTQMLFLGLDGLAVFLIGLVSGNLLWLAFGLVFAVGVVEAIVLGLGGAIFQSLVPPEMQGRVFSFLISLSYASAPVGLLVAGRATEALGLQFWWVMSGVVFALTAAAALLIPSVARIEDRRYRPARLGV